MGQQRCRTRAHEGVKPVRHIKPERKTWRRRRPACAAPYAAPPRKQPPTRTDADRTPPAHGTALHPGTRPSPHPSKAHGRLPSLPRLLPHKAVPELCAAPCSTPPAPVSPEPKAHRSPCGKSRPDILPPENAVCVICRMYIRFLQFHELHARRKAFARSLPAAEKKIHPKDAQHAFTSSTRTPARTGIFKARRFHNRCVDLTCVPARAWRPIIHVNAAMRSSSAAPRNGACQHGVVPEPSAQFPGWKNGRKKNGRQRPKSRWRQKNFASSCIARYRNPAQTKRPFIRDYLKNRAAAPDK